MKEIQVYLKIIYFLLYFTLHLTVYSQVTDQLILEKLGRKKRITYQIGDGIILKLINDQYEFSGIITDIFGNTIVIEDIYVNIQEIKYIKTVHTKGFLSPSNGPKIIIAGVGLFLIDQLNNSVIRGNDFRISEDIAITSAAMVGFGIFWTSLKYRKFKPGRNRRIRIFEIE